MICSTPNLLEKELKYIGSVFRGNNYPNWVIKDILHAAKERHQEPIEESEHIVDDENDEEMIYKKHLLTIPYQGKRGMCIINSMKKRLKNLLPDNILPIISYKGKKLNSCFNIKDKTPLENKNDIIYYGECSGSSCNDKYIGETKRRLLERIKDHQGRDMNSHIYKHSIETGHEVRQKDFKIIGTNYKGNDKKRKVAEALLIKQFKPSLNKQEKSLELKLYS